MADQVITFNQEGEFEAYYAACKWCKENGYSHGSMQSNAPIGLLRGDWIIAKWRNLDSSERELLAGTMSCVESFREPPVHIILKDKESK